MTLKNILFISFAFMLSSNCFAQDTTKTISKQNLVFGLKAGLNFSWFKAESANLKEGGFRPGIHYGLTADYYFNPHFAVSGELLITKLNGKIKFSDSLTYHRDTKTKKFKGVEYSFNNRYLQIPISLKYKTKTYGKLKYFGQIGFAPSFRITSRAKIIANGMLWPEDDIKSIYTNNAKDEIYEPDEFDDNVRFLNMAILFGGGVEYLTSKNSSIYGTLRVENGLTNVLISKTKTYTSMLSKNIGLSVGVYFK